MTAAKLGTNRDIHVYLALKGCGKWIVGHCLQPPVLMLLLQPLSTDRALCFVVSAGFPGMGWMAP